jgi:hypothetical protein
VGALAAGVAGAYPAVSTARSRLWVASGTLAGTYTNQIAWVNCTDTGVTGTSHESLTLAAKLSPGKPQPFTGGIGLVVKMTPGGHWSMSGAYPPRQEQPNGDIVCGAQQSFGCSGPVTREGDGRAVLAFRSHGRSVVGNFLEASSFHERRPDQDEPCPLDASMAAPLFGLDGTDIEVDALAESDVHPASFVVPASRFKGRKAFTVTHVGHPDGGCPRFYYSQCSETGTITLTLRFSHPR